MGNYALDAWAGIKCKMTSDHGYEMLSVCAPLAISGHTAYHIVRPSGRGRNSVHVKNQLRLVYYQTSLSVVVL